MVGSQGESKLQVALNLPLVLKVPAQLIELNILFRSGPKLCCRRVMSLG